MLSPGAIQTTGVQRASDSITDSVVCPAFILGDDW